MGRNCKIHLQQIAHFDTAQSVLGGKGPTGNFPAQPQESPALHSGGSWCQSMSQQSGMFGAGFLPSSLGTVTAPAVPSCTALQSGIVCSLRGGDGAAELGLVRSDQTEKGEIEVRS